MRILTNSRFAAALVTLGASLLVVSVAGAGSGQRLTRAQYDSKAKHICQTAKQREAAVPRPAGTAPSLAASVRALAKIGSKEVRSLEQLKPPTTLLRLVNRGLRSKTHNNAIMRSVASDLVAGTLSLEQATVKLANLPSDAATWNKIGAAVCQY